MVEALGTVVAKAVVVAYEQAAHPEAVVQHTLHKLLGRQLSHLQVEVQHLHTVYTSGFEQLQLGVGRRKELRHIGGMHHLARM